MKKIVYLFVFSCAMTLFLSAEQSNSSEYMKGYIDSKLEDKFSSAQIDVEVNDKNVVVQSWPADLPSNEIKNYLESICYGYLIQFNSLSQNEDTSCQNLQVEEDFVRTEPFEEGGFLPELNSFFPTMLAESYILGYSLGYRSYDKIFKSTIPVSIGDQFSLYQFKIGSTARLYFGIEACVWAVFKAKTQSLSLINADYYIGLPLTYINDKFSARLRIFHESSHLGDEFLLETPKIRRVNPSTPSHLNCLFGRRQSPGVEGLKVIPYVHIGSLLRLQPRELSRRPNRQFKCDGVLVWKD